MFVRTVSVIVVTPELEPAITIILSPELAKPDILFSVAAKTPDRRPRPLVRDKSPGLPIDRASSEQTPRSGDCSGRRRRTTTPNRVRRHS